MGMIFGTIELIIGLLLLLFPGVMAKLLRISPSRGGIGIKKEKGKLKAKMSPSLEKAFGIEKAKFWLRIVGIVVLILSVITYISPNAP